MYNCKFVAGLLPWLLYNIASWLPACMRVSMHAYALSHEPYRPLIIPNIGLANEECGSQDLYCYESVKNGPMEAYIMPA